jgi:outer membrane protein assembly factor BamD
VGPGWFSREDCLGLLLSSFMPTAPASAPMTARSTPLRLVLLLLVLALAGTGCARIKGVFKDENALEGVPVEQLYERGHASMRAGGWTRAIETYERLIAQYPYGPYTEQALMETAYAQYKVGRNDDAVSTIDRFIRTYPTHRNIPYLYYLRGLANSHRDTIFLQRVWRLDASRRDLATPTQAFQDFKIVVDRYPNSRYAEDARRRMSMLRDLFARHEMEVALYYLRRGAWVAAANRAEYVLETYPQSEFQNDAVATLAEAYTRLGNQTLAADARRVLELNDPNHPWLRGSGWPDYPWAIRKLNPFAGEKSALDN